MTPNEMTIAEAAEKFGIKHRSLWKAVHEGRVKGRKSGHTWLVEKHAMTVAIITGRVKVDKGMVDAMVNKYLASPTEHPGAIGGNLETETGTDMEEALAAGRLRPGGRRR